ncbi:uncharacterized protein LOC122085469 isoform X2 [Macadamia integrifolia]|uniref:uncharacterized protein LOC122085469 isoform X2 n=1 Tax=Macadamia integrifolia TaxID=60698 RepID=UPI001C4EE8FD|nr:uncharacterized protein LOC122085469 isoform X2 [Macadamia integrifolia]
MDDPELEILVSEQKRELMAANEVESDLDFAYRLQLQEALSASIALQPSSSSSPPIPPPPVPLSVHADEGTTDGDISHIRRVQAQELERFNQERKDRERCEAEMRRISYDLKLRFHDQQLAREIDNIPEDEWQEYGDNVERPMEEGCSSQAPQLFRLYFKGLISDEWVNGSKVKLSAIGVSICDPRDEVILQIQKPFAGDGMNNRTIDAKALIEGLNAALSLEIKNIVFYCDSYTLYQFISGKWSVKQRKLAMLVDQVVLLRRKFATSHPNLVARNDVKFAFKLARDAIDSQVTRSKEAKYEMILTETCTICLEDTELEQMFAVDGCLHRYCFSCMKQHVEVKLLHGMVPGCPHEGCKLKLSVDSCRKILTPKLVETMSQRIKESSIPVTEKIYCPYPRCSALMSKTEVLENAKNLCFDQTDVRKCIKCHGLFCVNCKVPWHYNMTCSDYRRSNPYPRAEDAKLKSLATQKFWRQCVKCNHMIELAEGVVMSFVIPVEQNGKTRKPLVPVHYFTRTIF